jgi:DNA-binding SARP family transcriptional activator
MGVVCDGVVDEDNDHDRDKSNRMVCLTLMGPAENCIPAAAGRLSTRKAVAVLGYLAMRGPDPVPRSDLASLLWADVPHDQARHSLRQSLWQIRAALPPHGAHLLTTDREMVRLDVRRMRVDARSMEWLLKRGTPTSVRRACALYRGDFLAGLRVPEPAFEQWLAAERSRLHALGWAAYRLRLEELVANGSAEEAAAVALRMIRMDRFAEAPRSALLAAYAERGEFAAACRHYEAFSRLLWRGFGIEPSIALEQFFQHCAEKCGWSRPSRPRRGSERGHASRALARKDGR